jgi:hypothetical protein
MRNRILLLIIFASVSFMACDRFSKYPGFKKARHGIYYQLLTIGDDSVKAGPGDYITVDLTYLTMNDSVFFNGTRKFQVNIPAYDGAIDECFEMLSVEESAAFIIRADSFFAVTLQTALPRFIDRGSAMKVKIEMLDIQSEEDYIMEKEAFLSWIEDFGDYEKVILQQFINEEKLDVSPLPSGIYYLNIKPGTGKKVEQGDTITEFFLIQLLSADCLFNLFTEPNGRLLKDWKKPLA